MMSHHKVRDVMTTDPVTVTPATPLRYVADIVARQKISSVPVLSVRGKLVGLVAESDLLRKKELKRDPDGEHSKHMTYRERRAAATAETAGEIMNTNPVTVLADATVAEAARLMDRYGATCLPVVDESGNLVGVVGPWDLLRVFSGPDGITTEITRETLVGGLVLSRDQDKPGPTAVPGCAAGWLTSRSTTEPGRWGASPDILGFTSRLT
jgi:CBS domain-containing protein